MTVISGLVVLFYEIWFTERAWFIGIFTVDIFVGDIAFTED